ncbi:hypothetical protein JAAARDRAFT_36128 [Jaapia argillacea MUCL 33604]|uniref:Hydrophobin n=1 Tax=Jaapia argillacea MUCL 33604 TaxID=933084 RepID=A0A067PS34_9AGAM|nr:hypothetical protein JAAARDRAFT_36128 [Jaapia argillacea MUCL 33604]
MKFTSSLAVVAAVVVSVDAAAMGPNAQRMAQGLPPLPPRNLGTGVFGAKRTAPSSSPSTCSAGHLQCCDTVTTSSNSEASTIIELLGIPAEDVTGLLGLTCSTLTGNKSCRKSTVCCEDNDYNGIISLGCTTVTS